MNLFIILNSIALFVGCFMAITKASLTSLIPSPYSKGTADTEDWFHFWFIILLLQSFFLVVLYNTEVLLFHSILWFLPITFLNFYCLFFLFFSGFNFDKK